MEHVFICISKRKHFLVQAEGRQAVHACVPQGLLLSTLSHVPKAHSIGYKESPFEPNLKCSDFKYGHIESKCPPKDEKLQCVSLNIKLLKTARLKRSPPPFFKPTNKKLFCGLTTETGSKYIKIFYPIICFDQLTTILKIQSWSS